MLPPISEKQVLEVSLNGLISQPTLKVLLRVISLPYKRRCCGSGLIGLYRVLACRVKDL